MFNGRADMESINFLSYSKCYSILRLRTSALVFNLSEERIDIQYIVKHVKMNIFSDMDSYILMKIFHYS